ncbi:MAG: helix-turn-helix domain-containing protein [Alphaproteobacteria bacterium]|nr:helix-turn-helix domain-containing protein [Alphaproteobacteria bacterium]
MTPETFRHVPAAHYIGIAPSTLGKMRSRGDGPAYIKAGKAVVYRKTDLDAWLEQNRRRSTSQRMCA